MYIIIVGGGKLGYYLAKTLAPDKHTLVLIEEDLNLCKKIVDELSVLGVQVIHGDGTDIHFLEDASIDRADILIAVTGYDENNLVACQLAKNYFNVARTIARVNNPKNINVFKQLGVDSVVSSTALITDIIELEVDWACLNNMLSHRVGNIRIKEIQVDRHARSAGKKIVDLKLPEETIIISIIRENHLIIPDGQAKIQTGDNVVVITHADNIAALSNYF
jgi:trk system potassium uptake protein TrkA